MPHGVEQLALQHCERDDVIGLARQLDVRVTTNDAGGRARGIEEDALERLAVPPGGGVAAVGGDQFGAQFQAFEVLAHPHQAFGFKVHGDDAGQLGFGFEDMAGLAAGCTASVEHALARRQVQQIGSQLCRFVLHADPAFGEARQAAHVGGCIEDDAIAAVNACIGGDTRFTEQAKVGITAVMAAVDPQNHGRVRVVRRANGFPLLGPEGFERFLQPARVGGAHYRVVFQLGQQGFAFPLRAAQYGIEQGLGPGFFQLVGATHGFADRGVGRDSGVEQLVEAH
ncbi:hypothetical protein D3C76_864050 [compost metagenome]